MTFAFAWLPWLVAAGAGLLAAAVGYWPVARGGVLPAALRGSAVALAVALLLDAPAGRAARPAPLVAVDVSASMARGGALGAWQAAAARARREGAVLAVGDSIRPLASGEAPADARSFVGPAVDRAAAMGRPLVLYTDGEVDDPASLAALPAGSRIERVASGSTPDAALADLAAPRAVSAGDTIRGTVRVLAAAGGSAGTSMDLALDGRTAARVAVPALGAFAEATLPFTVLAPARGPALLRAALAAGDGEPRNDTLLVVLDVSDAAAAVSVSTSPDYDWRYATALMREAASVPVRAYVRVAPGAWREDATFRAVDEAEVRSRVRAAALVLLHGDTLAFGAPAAATRGSLVLYPASRDRATGEWFAGAAPSSPAAAALADAPWDSLPPIDPPVAAPAASWVALTAREARRGEAMPVVIGREGPRRSAVILASGLWRWRFRGGVAARTYGALWGSIFDWAAAELAPREALVAADGVTRAGDPIHWRRAPTTPDSLELTLVRRGGTASGTKLPVRFAPGATVGESPSVAAGVYEVRGAAAGLLVVNASREWVPRRPVAATATAASLSVARVGLRTLGWPFVLVVLLLCAEWMLRRRAGWR